MCTLDVISTEITRSRIESLAEEMQASLRRTLRSPLLSETEDFATGLIDAQGRLLAASTRNPVHYVPLRQSVQTMLRELKFELENDDVIIINNPYQGGTHLSDITMVRICYIEGDLLLLPACRAHMEDIGCAAPGSLFPQAYELYQEGDRIPPLFLYKAGRLREDVLTKMEKNSRVPDILLSTLQAMSAATQLGARRIEEMTSEFGTHNMPKAIDEILDYGERLAANKLKEWPDGKYSGRATCPTDFQGNENIQVQVAIQAEDGYISLDFESTDNQVTGFVNSTLSNTAAHAISALLPFLSVPVNDGLLRRIRIVAPEGSVVNAKFPAPVGWSSRHVGSEIMESVTRALSSPMPDQTGVTWAEIPHVSISRYNFQEQTVYLDETLMSSLGGGGTRDQDGWGWPALLSAFKVPSVEVRERERPVLVEEREFITDSCGPGEWRGSPGTLVAERVGGDGYRLLTYVPTSSRPGLQEGLRGANSAVWLEREGERIEPQPGVFNDMKKNDRLVRVYGGGPGWGRPERRSPDTVYGDVLDALVSEQHARETYGVAVDAKHNRLEPGETESLRTSMGEVPGRAIKESQR